jgi:2-keto-4-pentenoate hydratase
VRQAQSIAQALDEAWEQCAPIAPLTEAIGIETLEQAYEIQSCWHALRERNGDRSTGHKIGLSSRVMQQQFGIDEPDFGRMWASRQFRPRDGAVTIWAGQFIQPRVETELAVRIKHPLRGPGVTVEQVLASIDAVTVAIEIIDSRIADWRIKLFDTVSDNASYGGFALGPWESRLAHQDLRALEVAIHCGNGGVERGQGSAALGHPAAAVAWLANKLAQFDAEIEAGAVVLTGSLCRALPVRSGDEFDLELECKPRFTARFI